MKAIWRMTKPGDKRQRRTLLPQLFKFGAVGAVGFVINLIVFNALRMTVFDPVVVHHGPLYATVIATIVAIAANWVGNRYWAFSAQRRQSAAREGMEFFLVSLAGMGIPLLCLWLSHYVFGYTSLLADNIANNGIGLALGMLFRFALYRWWVFSPDRHLAAGDGTLASELPATPDSRLVGER